MFPYHMNFNSSDSPKIWWLSTDDTNDNLQRLALQVLGITPHSAGCERVFSTLSWIYGKRRTWLSISLVESMAKIRSFQMIKIRKELKYGQNYSVRQLRDMVEETMDDIDDDGDDDDNLDDVEMEQEPLVIPDNEVFVLIENIFDLNDIPFIRKPDDPNDDDDDDTDSETSEENEKSAVSYNKKQIYEYDTLALAAEYVD